MTILLKIWLALFSVLATVAHAEVTEIALGGDHTCPLTGGAIECWGLNSNGQLGDGTITSAPLPSTCSGSRRRRASLWAHPLVCPADGWRWVKCSGSNVDASSGTDHHDAPHPADVSGITTATSLSLAGGTCALLGRDQVLGLQQRRPARGLDHHQPHHPGRCDRDHDGDEPRSGRLPLVRCADGRRDQVLGLQRLRPGRRREHYYSQNHPRRRFQDHDGDEPRRRRTLVRPTDGQHTGAGAGTPRTARGRTSSRYTPSRVDHATTSTHSGDHTYAPDGWRDEVLGLQQLRPARGQDHRSRSTPVDVSGITTATSLALGGSPPWPC